MNPKPKKWFSSTLKSQEPLKPNSAITIQLMSRKVDLGEWTIYI